MASICFAAKSSTWPILDATPPGRDKFEVLGSLREKRIRIPVLLLTGQDAVGDNVHELDTGADDCLVKPFGFPELLARVRALLRRGNVETGSRIRVGDLELDITDRCVTRSGQLIDLTSKEYDILEYLSRNRERVVSREMLAREIWKEAAQQIPLENVIDVHVTHLRRKLDERFKTKLLHTVRGLGFVLREEST